MTFFRRFADLFPMASSLRRIFSHGGAVRSGFVSRPFSSEALVEIKSGEIGMVSGIPEEHLHRRVSSQFHNASFY